MCWTTELSKKSQILVSVAGCLGYDVLAIDGHPPVCLARFSCWLFRL